MSLWRSCSANECNGLLNLDKYSLAFVHRMANNYD